MFKKEIATKINGENKETHLELEKCRKINTPYGKYVCKGVVLIKAPHLKETDIFISLHDDNDKFFGNIYLSELSNNIFKTKVKEEIEKLKLDMNVSSFLDINLNEQGLTKEDVEVILSEMLEEEIKITMDKVPYILIKEKKIEMDYVIEIIQDYMELKEQGIKYNYFLQTEISARRFFCDKDQFDSCDILGEALNNVYKAVIYYQNGLYEEIVDLSEVEEVEKKKKLYIKRGFVVTQSGAVKF